MILKAKEWKILLTEKFNEQLKSYFQEIYGNDKRVIEERRRAFLTLILLYIEKFSENDYIVLTRAPGRVNVMGRHVDYMGGYVNPIATNFEIIAAVGKRSDDYVVMYNTDPQYKPKKFRISEIMPKHKIRNLKDWDEWTSQVFKKRMERGEKYDWDDYIKGLIIYLQEYYRVDDTTFTKKFHGLNIVVSGNIPPKRGLSSSSALVIAIALALKEFLNIEMSISEFIDRVGYSEWYRMTRGGSADHAAILLSKRGYISHIRCLPTQLTEIGYAPFPKGYKLVVIDSGFERPHTEEAINYLRVTAAEYRLAVLYLKTKYPEYASKIKLLRDVNIKNLNITLAELYRMIKSLPMKITRRELRRFVDKKYLDELESIFENHKEPPQGYKLRQRALFGLAETERAYVFPQFLRRGDINSIFRLIRVSHDGDRVAKFDKYGNKVPWDPSKTCSDEILEELIKILESGSEEEKKKAQLYWQPGAYERSIEPIDYMCDMINLNLSNYAAAQLMGAGLGGNVLVLVRQDKIEELRKLLFETYYTKYGIKPEFSVIEPSSGASLLKVKEGKNVF